MARPIEYFCGCCDSQRAVDDTICPVCGSPPNSYECLDCKKLCGTKWFIDNRNNKADLLAASKLKKIAEITAYTDTFKAQLPS